VRFNCNVFADWVIVFQLTAPSPTVNMKNAMNVVMGMFNDSIHPGGEFGWQKQDTNDDDILEAQFAAPDSDCKSPRQCRL
jgi:hypothetical protein